VVVEDPAQQRRVAIDLRVTPLGELRAERDEAAGQPTAPRREVGQRLPVADVDQQVLGEVLQDHRLVHDRRQRRVGLRADVVERLLGDSSRGVTPAEHSRILY
jgi:hypothetical protein